MQSVFQWGSPLIKYKEMYAIVEIAGTQVKVEKVETIIEDKDDFFEEQKEEEVMNEKEKEPVMNEPEPVEEKEEEDDDFWG